MSSVIPDYFTYLFNGKRRGTADAIGSVGGVAFGEASVRLFPGAVQIAAGEAYEQGRHAAQLSFPLNGAGKVESRSGKLGQSVASGIPYDRKNAVFCQYEPWCIHSASVCYSICR